MNANITFFAASYGPRYSDASGTFVAIERGQNIVGASGIGRKLEELAEHAAEYERFECEAECALCEDDNEPCTHAPEILAYSAFTYDAHDLFHNARELAEHRRALMNGEIVVLYN